MPYVSNDDLPVSVRRHLPEHAQDIYRAAFNHAYADHAHDPRREEAAHRIAWAAVNRSYVKLGSSWIAKAELE
jgi:cation transport regulator